MTPAGKQELKNVFGTVEIALACCWISPLLALRSLQSKLWRTCTWRWAWGASGGAFTTKEVGLEWRKAQTEEFSLPQVLLLANWKDFRTGCYCVHGMDDILFARALFPTRQDVFQDHRIMKSSHSDCRLAGQPNGEDDGEERLGPDGHPENKPLGKVQLDEGSANSGLTCYCYFYFNKLRDSGLTLSTEYFENNMRTVINAWQ